MNERPPPRGTSRRPGRWRPGGRRAASPYHSPVADREQQTGQRRRSSTFGNVRKLPSGRLQASYWHEGRRFTAPATFGSKADAHLWLATSRTEISQGRWVNPEAGREDFETYARQWLSDRHDLRPRTRELYKSELERHLLPSFGKMALASITTAKVRSWHAGIAKTTPVTAAKCYRLLRTILGTAVADGMLLINPCVIKGAGQERSAERPIPTVSQVDSIAANLPERYQALVYTAAYGGLRLGECAALTRDHVDLLHRTIAVTEQAHRIAGVGRVIGEPKSEAGRRTVAIPRLLASVLEDHLTRFVAPEPDALVFLGDRGGTLERSNWSVRFAHAREAAGLEELRFHDLRHFAGTMAAQTGATTRELMSRLGHSSSRAALRYQHATSERDVAIADGLDALVALAHEAPQVPVTELLPQCESDETEIPSRTIAHG